MTLVCYQEQLQTNFPGSDVQVTTLDDKSLIAVQGELES